MPTTTLTEFTGSIDTIAGRTDDAGASVQDWSAKERRMAHMLFSEGVFLTNHWQVVAGAGGTMNAIVGSGGANVDLALVSGQNAGQGRYLVRLDEVSKTITLNAADASNPRIDEIYLIVSDDLYDSSGRSLPRLAYRRGDAAGAPVPPGPDASWDAYYLLSEISVPGGAADIQSCTFTDKRVRITPLVDQDHAARHLVGGGDPLGTLATSQIPNLDSGKITSGVLAVARIPDLSGSKITSGTVAFARLPTGTGSSQVAVGNHGHTSLSSSLVINTGVLTLNRNNRSVALVVKSNQNNANAAHAQIEFTTDTGDGSKIVGWRYDLSTRMGVVIYGYNNANIPGFEVDQFGNSKPAVDNDKLLGTSTRRWTQVWAVNGTIQTSDPEAKKNMTPADSRGPAAAILKSVAPIEFEWKDGEAGRHFGFDADDVESVLPEAVVVPEEGFKGIKPFDMLAVLWQASRELSERLEVLENA